VTQNAGCAGLEAFFRRVKILKTHST